MIERAERALQRVGLAEAAPRIAGALSHGEQRQLEIAMALASEPKVLLLDEPLAGMGPEESQRLTALLKDLAREHALLLIEHDMDFVFAVADWMTVMAEGTVLARGPARGDPRQHRRAGRLSRGPRVMPAPRARPRCSRAASSTPTTARATCCAACRSASAPARPSA